MKDRKTLSNLGIEYEHLSPLDEVVYKGKHYFVSTAHYVSAGKDNMQIVRLIRMADFHSNRMKRPSISVRADECKIIRDSDEE